MSEPTLYIPSLIEQLQVCAADRRNLEEARAVMQAVIAKLRALRAELETTRQERDDARRTIDSERPDYYRALRDVQDALKRLYVLEAALRTLEQAMRSTGESWRINNFPYGYERPNIALQWATQIAALLSAPPVTDPPRPEET